MLLLITCSSLHNTLQQLLLKGHAGMLCECEVEDFIFACRASTRL